MRLGRFIGKGFWRDVYQHPDLPDAVVKILNPKREQQKTLFEGGYNPNRCEWDMWQRFKDTKERVHLCPCISISDDGRTLVMAKADASDTEFSHTIPDIFRELLDAKDFHMCWNWGIYHGRPVLIDYGNLKLDEQA